MSRSLHDHQWRTDDLVDDLATRVAHLEACFSHRRDTADRAVDEIRREARSHKSGRSTPSRVDEVQFFDISDHDRDIPRPDGLPPAPGSLFPGATSSIPRSSPLGPVDHGSPPGCHAAPVEKASTARRRRVA